MKVDSVLDCVETWLENVSGGKLAKGSWTRTYADNIPRQTSSCDCGVFTIL